MTDYLAEGIRYYETGDIAQAQRLFAQAVSSEPRSSDAWIWLGRAIDEAEKKRYCFQLALDIDPDSLEAAEALFALERPVERQTTPEVPLPPPTPPLPSQPDPVAAVAARLQSPPFPSAEEVPTEQPGEAVPAVPARAPSRFASLDGKWLLAAGGLLVGLILVIVLVTRLVNGVAVPTSTPTGTSQASSGQVTSIPLQSMQTAPGATAAHIPAQNPTSAKPTATTDATHIPQTPTASIQAADPVSRLLEQGQYTEAIHLLDQQISTQPDSGAAYSQRGIAYFRLEQGPQPGNVDVYRRNLARAIGDLDAAIRLGPARADDFAYRGMAYAALANVSQYRVDRDKLNATALENLQSATTLGTKLTSVPVDLAFVLVNTGKCDQAQLAANEIASAKPSGSAEAELYDLYAAIDTCQGKLELAAEAKQKAIAIEKTCGRLTDLAYIQYNLDKTEQALDTVNQCIKSGMEVDGADFYLRALIYYDYGNNELAEKDLLSGARNTWFTGGVSAYVRGRISLDTGQEDKGVSHLQEAEASMTLREGPALLALVQHDLAVLGSPRFSPAPSSPFQSTPLPPALQATSSSQP
jgi:tetratricopeptide (TPR) repeat protein